MLIGHNTIRYFEDKTLTRWENADNKHIYMYFKTGKIPPFALVCDTGQSTAKVQIFNAYTDEAVGDDKEVTIGNIWATDRQLTFLGFDLTGMEEGCYYSKIVTAGNTETYYSEVFAWTEDSISNLKENNLLKLTVTSSDITIGVNYDIDLTGIVYECFFEVQDPNEDPDIKEVGVEKPYGDIPVFNTRVLRPSFNFIGNYDMLEFLSGLRTLATNGTIIFTYNGLSRTAIDIAFELEENHPNQEIISGNLKYTRNDYISSKNV